MRRADRLFEIIQMLRAARQPVTAARMAERLEVAPRTVYRDLAALQAQRVPIEGGRGVGYVMRQGYDLPPLQFDAEEIEAIRIGLDLIRRTGDEALEASALRASEKIALVLPDDSRAAFGDSGLSVSAWRAVPPQSIDLRLVRRAIREERKLKLHYCDGCGELTERTIRPIALTYHWETIVIAAWCELREALRHFRADRVLQVTALTERFSGSGAELRALWQASQAQ